MIKMLRRYSVAIVILAIAFGFGQITTVFSAEPTVEVPPGRAIDTTDNESSEFIFPKVPLSLSVFARGGYDNNFRTTESARGSWFTNEGATITYDSPGALNHLNLRSGVDLTYYPDQSGTQTDNVNAYLDTSLVRHVWERLKLDLSAYAAYRTEPDFGSNVGIDTRQGNYFHTLETISVSYEWTKRLSTVTSDKFQLVQYENNSALAASLDRYEETVGQELRYELLHAGNTLVAEYRFGIVDYDTTLRNSVTHSTLVGLNEDFTSSLKATARGGATFRSYNQGREEIDPHFEGSLSYSGAHHSLLSWTASYGIEEPSSTNVLSRTTFRTGLAFKYAFTGRITATANAYYHHDENKGTVPTAITTGTPMSGLSEDAFDVSVNLRYVMNRRFSFDAGFQHSEIKSEQVLRDYSRYRYSAGLTFNY